MRFVYLFHKNMLITLSPFDNILVSNYPQNRHILLFCVNKSVFYPQNNKIIHIFINNLENLLKHTKYKVAIKFLLSAFVFFFVYFPTLPNKLSTAVYNFVDNLLRCL